MPEEMLAEIEATRKGGEPPPSGSRRHMEGLDDSHICHKRSGTGIFASHGDGKHVSMAPSGDSECCSHWTFIKCLQHSQVCLLNAA